MQSIQEALESRAHPWFISHIRSHSKLPGILAEGNERTDALIMTVDMESYNKSECYTSNFTFLLRIYISPCSNCLCPNVNTLQGPVPLAHLLHHWVPLADQDLTLEVCSPVQPGKWVSLITQPLVIIGMYILW